MLLEHVIWHSILDHFHASRACSWAFRFGHISTLRSYLAGGSTLEAMAAAVENASMVIIGASTKYKDSVSCRTGMVRHISAYCPFVIMFSATLIEISSLYFF